MACDLHIVSLVKGSERYSFIYDTDHWSEAVTAVMRQATCPGLSLTAVDAQTITGRILFPPPKPTHGGPQDAHS